MSRVIREAPSSSERGTLQKYQNRTFNLTESSKAKYACSRSVLNVREIRMFDGVVMSSRLSICFVLKIYKTNS